MSVVSDALAALREALKLSDDVKRVGDALKELAKESRDQDRRITRLEAQWDTAMKMAERVTPRAIENKRGE